MDTKRHGAMALGAAAVLLMAACTEAAPTATPKVMETPAAQMQKTPETAMMDKTPDAMMDKGSMGGEMVKLPEQQFAAHFVSSEPAHGAKLMASPSKITLNFNFTLGEASAVKVMKDGKDLMVAKPSYMGDKLSMSVAVPSAEAGNGVYVVDYNACWPDGSCHKGKFGFYVGS